MSSLLEQRSAPASAPVADDLERLWDAPVAAEPAEGTPADAPPASAGILGPLVGFGWVAFLLVAAVVGSATGADEVERAAWVGPAGLALLVLLGSALFAASVVPRLAFGLCAVAGAIGIALGIDCRVSAHHLGAWWMVETAVVAGLAAASVAGIVRLSRR